MSCSPSTITVTLGAADGAAGNLAYPFTVTNRASQPCPIGGYFGVSVYDQQGHIITSSATRDSATQPDAIELAPGATAHFGVIIGDTSPSGNSQTCPLIGSFHLIPPNSTGTTQVALAASANDRDCGGARVEATTP